MKKRGRIVAFFLVIAILAGVIGTTFSNLISKVNLGLDLQGGFEVLYEVEPVEDGQEISNSLMENMDAVTMYMKEYHLKRKVGV